MDNNVLSQLSQFYRDLSKVDTNGSAYWSNLYADIVNSLENKRDKGGLLNSYKKFNKFSSTKRLYHEIRKDIGDFEDLINPLELFVPKIVTPRIIDQRINNQRGYLCLSLLLIIMVLAKMDNRHLLALTMLKSVLKPE
ncbi:hypothetical protein BSG92_15530 (plasmid) [Lactiplantibacillus plantarum subsp. plantarum]|nr:hypothetical protein BSG92_15530 [Lactiplantibacillus plantarum subsp. plantarum]